MQKDVYEYEEEQERLAMLKNIFLPMKLWYNKNIDYFKEKFGDFPLFWQDLQKWENQRVIQKIYLVCAERSDRNEEVDIKSIENAILNPQNNVTTSDALLKKTEEEVNDAEERKKKRRSRWGVTEEAPAPTNSLEIPTSLSSESLAANGDTSTTQVADGDGNKKRRSRWSTVDNAEANNVIPSVAPILPAIAPIASTVISQEVLQQTLVLQMQLKQINEKLLTVVQDAKIKELDPNRSPSPPPRYDGMGKRVNTREVRMRESLSNQRTRVIEEMIRLNPLFQPPPDFVRQKPYRKIYVPYQEYPNYNFIGLIIGPRGNTQKRMEKESNCKISIRGKGSLKEGSKGRAAKNPDEDDELHVHIAGETEENVALAAKMVAELLVPVDDEKNEHKQKQLRELALINGTLREDEYCTVCGEKGHRHFECPQRSKTFQAAGVKCAICGDQSHPTRDCPLKENAPKNEVTLDSEYNSFMAELGDEGPSTQNVDGTTGNATSNNTDSNKKPQQTIIHSTTLLTGTTMPPFGAVGAVPMQYPAPMMPNMYGQQMWAQPGMMDPATSAAYAAQWSSYGGVAMPYGAYGQVPQMMPWMQQAGTVPQPYQTHIAPLPTQPAPPVESYYVPPHHNSTSSANSSNDIDMS